MSFFKLDGSAGIGTSRQGSEHWRTLTVLLLVLIGAALAGCSSSDASPVSGKGEALIPAGMEGAEASEYLLDRLFEFEKQVDKGDVEVAWSKEDLGWESLPSLRDYLGELQLEVARPPFLLQLPGSRPPTALWGLRDEIASWPEVYRVRPWREDFEPKAGEAEARLELGVWVADYDDLDQVDKKLQSLLGPEDSLERTGSEKALETVGDMLAYLESVSRAPARSSTTTSQP